MDRDLLSRDDIRLAPNIHKFCVALRLALGIGKARQGVSGCIPRHWFSLGRFDIQNCGAIHSDVVMSSLHAKKSDTLLFDGQMLPSDSKDGECAIIRTLYLTSAFRRRASRSEMTAPPYLAIIWCASAGASKIKPFPPAGIVESFTSWGGRSALIPYRVL